MPPTVFDGHNDALGRMQAAGEPPRAFLEGRPGHHLDLERARRGGLAGGLFAVHAASPRAPGSDAERPGALPPRRAAPVQRDEAAAFTLAAIGRAHALAGASAGAVAVVRDAADLDACRRRGTLAMVLHVEGAEAIDRELWSLETLHAAGLRSLGPVWSRPNAFGHGVPFRFPSSPDTGAGLTAAGRRLVRRCAELGILVDLSHMNAAGFADVAALGLGPLVASHSGCHALCPASRNLTDEQIRAIGRSGGLLGIVFTPPFLREDGAADARTPLGTIVAHVRHAADLIGVEHVALGSDFDGAQMPDELPDAGALPALLDALGEDGFSGRELEAIAWGNWRRVLGAVWR